MMSVVSDRGSMMKRWATSLLYASSFMLLKMKIELFKMKDLLKTEHDILNWSKQCCKYDVS
jgi:hypothetical protein